MRTAAPDAGVNFALPADMAESPPRGPRVIGQVDEVQTLAINSAFQQMLQAREQLVRVWAACGLGEFDGAASYEIRGGDVILNG